MKYYVNDSTLSSLADTIRSKAGLSGPLAFPSGFQSAVEGISAPYYGIYKVLAEKLPFVATGSTTSSYTYTASEVSAYCDSFSGLTEQQFAGVKFSGSFTFNNLSTIRYYAFGSVYANTGAGTFYFHTFNFPLVSTILNGAFYKDQYLSGISAPECDFIGAYAFSGCTQLTTLNFPKCLSIYENAFAYDWSITTASFSSCTYIGPSAFYTCSNLSNIYCPNCNKIDGGAFQYCRSLFSIDLPNCTHVSQNVFYGCEKLSQVNLPICASIGSYAFYGCSLLTTINLSQCSAISYMAFCRCSSLNTVSLPVCTNISGYAFSSCVNLISLYLNNVSTVTVLSTGAFASTPIGGYSTVAGRYGSVFVPASLYSSFITATNWVAISSRIVSV